MARVEMHPMKKEDKEFDVKVIDETEKSTPATGRVKREPVARAKKKAASVFDVFKDAFIMEGEEPFAHFLAKEIAYGLKDAIVEIVNSGMTNAFYGDRYDGGRYRRDRYYDDRRYTRYDYSRRYSYDRRDDRRRRDDDDDYRDGRRRANPKKFEAIECDTKGEAMDILKEMSNILDECDVVSVADMNDLAGVSTTPEENNFGWDRQAFSEVHLTKTRYNTYIIDLPSPIPIK